MAIDKLNFTGAGYGGDFKSSQENIGDDLLQLGKYLETKKQNDLERLRQESKDKYQRDRDALQDTRYDADKKQKADENAAISNYANQVNMYQTGNALGQAQGQEISDMADKLTASGVTGSDFDKQLNDRVNQMYSQNRTRVGSNPTDALAFVKENVIVPQGVDPSKIIQINDNLENKFIRMQEKKDDLEYRREKDKEDSVFRKQQLGMQQQQLNASLQERADRLKEKQEERESIINARNVRNEFINDPASSNIDETIIKKETGRNIIPEEKKATYQSEINKVLESDKNTGNVKRIEELANSGLYTDKELNDPVKLQQILKEKYPEEYKSPELLNKATSVFETAKLNIAKNSELNEIRKNNPLPAIPFGGFTSQEDRDAYNKSFSNLKAKEKDVEQKYDKTIKKDNTSDLVQRLKTENTSKLNEIDKLVNENTKSFEEADKELKKTLGVKETVSKKIPKATEEYRADVYDSMIKKIKNPTVYDVERIGKTVDDMTSRYDEDKKNKEASELKLQLKRIENADDKTKNLVDVAKQDRAGKVAELNQIQSGAAIKENLLDDDGNKIDKKDYVKLLNEKIYDYDKKINSLLKITDEDIKSELKR